MMIKKIILFSLSIKLSYSPAQTIAGKILSKDTKEPISFANIGVLGKATGAICDEHGNFVLTLEEKLNQDTLRVSMIGYQPIKMKVIDFKKEYSGSNYHIYLKEASFSFMTVEVKAKKIKTTTAGHKYSNKNVILGLLTDNQGCEIAELMKVKRRENWVKDITINIANNPFDSVMLRVNLYNSVNGKPAENILNESIYVNCKIKNGPVHINLSNKSVVAKDDFFVAVQWLAKSKKETLNFCAGFGGKTYIRYGVEDEWFHMTLLGLGINCKINYE